MTLNEIIARSLGKLDRGTDAQTMDTYRDKFTAFANIAVQKIADHYQPQRTEKVELDGHSFNLGMLSHGCQRIVSVAQGGKPVSFDMSDTGVFAVNATGAVDVSYIFYPKELSSTTDVPEIPTFSHWLIPEYVVARERAGGDASTQNTAAVYYQEFNTGIVALPRSSHGDPKSYRFRNQW